MSYTPIDKFSLKRDGKEIYSYLENLIKHDFYNGEDKKNIYLRSAQFDVLWETLSPHEKKFYTNNIPFFGHSLVKAGR